MQELLLLKARLAYRQGRMDRSSELVAAAGSDVRLLTYRDQIRFRLPRDMPASYAGDPGAEHRLRELAAQVQAARMPDLSAEVWRAIAEGAPAARTSG